MHGIMLKNSSQKDLEDRVPKYTFLPFGVGARSCLGKKFAEMEMFLLVIYIVKNFKLKSAMTQKPKRTLKTLISFDKDIMLEIEQR
jgi:cytochrome P450